EIEPLLENINSTLAAKLKTTASNEKPAAVTAAAGSSEESLWARLGAGTADSSETGATHSLQQQFAAQNPVFHLSIRDTVMTEQGQPALAPGPMVGYSNLRDTAKVNNFLKDPLVRQIIPGNVRLVWGVKPDPQTPEHLSLYAIKAVGQEGAVLSGNVITDAR